MAAEGPRSWSFERARLSSRAVTHLETITAGLEAAPFQTKTPEE
jgi:hypothetical protein